MRKEATCIFLFRRERVQFYCYLHILLYITEWKVAQDTIKISLSFGHHISKNKLTIKPKGLLIKVSYFKF